MGTVITIVMNGRSDVNSTSKKAGCTSDHANADGRVIKQTIIPGAKYK